MLKEASTGHTEVPEAHSELERPLLPDESSDIAVNPVQEPLPLHQTIPPSMPMPSLVPDLASRAPPFGSYVPSFLVPYFNTLTKE